MDKELHRFNLVLTAPQTEFSFEFAQGMANRMAVSYHKYGAVADGYPSKFDALASAIARIEKYIETGNTEYLIDAANFCLEPSVRVWMDDLSLLQLGDIEVGDRVIAFDENPTTRRTQRSWKSAEVTAIHHLILPTCRVIFDSGLEVVASIDHRWLTATHRPNSDACSYWWTETGRDGRTGLRQHSDHFVPIIAPVINERSDRDAGYVAGFLDGEGNVGQMGGRKGTLKVSWAQNVGLVQERMERIMKEGGYDLGTYVRENPNAICVVNSIRGGIWESQRALMEFRPTRLLAQTNPDKWGAVRRHSLLKVVDVEPTGEREVIAMTTTSGTFVAEGIGHHNCMIEAMCPRHPNAFFVGTDSDGSIGRVTNDGETTLGGNADTLVTKGGSILTTERLDELVEEAEAGYDISRVTGKAAYFGGKLRGDGTDGSWAGD